jgi:Tfp pilus assembly protein PilV
MTFSLRKNKKNGGVSLVEVLVGCAIIITSVISILAVFGNLTKLAANNTIKIQGELLAEEGEEALRLMRDDGWDANIGSLTVGSTYRLAWATTSGWRATTSRAQIDDTFERTFVLSAVNRDSTSYDIVTSGGTLDSDTKKAVVSVSWAEPSGTSTKTVELYLYNSYDN